MRVVTSRQGKPAKDRLGQHTTQLPKLARHSSAPHIKQGSSRGAAAPGRTLTAAGRRYQRPRYTVPKPPAPMGSRIVRSEISIDACLCRFRISDWSALTIDSVQMCLLLLTLNRRLELAARDIGALIGWPCCSRRGDVGGSPPPPGEPPPPPPPPRAGWLPPPLLVCCCWRSLRSAALNAEKSVAWPPEGCTLCVQRRRCVAGSECSCPARSSS